MKDSSNANERDAIDHAFIASKTEGFESMVEAAQQTSWEQIVSDSGISEDKIRTAGRLLSSSSATIACWAMGLTQHRNGVAVIQEVVNLLLMNGHVGRKGAGFCPVRGHSNVQGDRTVGIWEAPTEKFLARMEQGLGFSVPRQHGLMWFTPSRPCRVNLSMCSSAWAETSSPQPRYGLTANALGNVGLTVQVSTKLNRSHLVTGKNALILPVWVGRA